MDATPTRIPPTTEAQWRRVFSRRLWVLLAMLVVASGEALAEPAWEDATASVRYVRAHLDARVRELRGAQSDVDLPAPPDVPAAGACVTIRLDGRTIGRGVSMGGARALGDAAQAALDEAVAALPGGGDALLEQERAQSLARSLVGVELAGELVSMDLETYVEADAIVRPGLDAVVLRWDGSQHGAFPARQVHAGETPSRALVSLLASASGDPGLPIAGVATQEARAMREKHRASFARAPVLHAIELVAGGAPIPAWRGGRLVGLHEVGGESLARARDELVTHLARRTVESKDGLALWTTIWPTQGRVDEARATPLQTLIVAIALLAGAGASPGAGGEAGRIDLGSLGPGESRAATLARTLLGDLAAREAVAQSSTLEEDPVLAGAWSVALSQWSRIEELGEKAWLGRLGNRVLAGLRVCAADGGAPGERGAHGEFVWAERASVPTRGLIALGLAHAESGAWAGDTTGLPDARAALRTIYRDAPGGHVVTHLPWAGYAELVLAGAGAVEAAPVLREARAACWSRQVTHEVASRDGADLEGGLMLGVGGGGTLPTWQSARPLALFGAMLRDERLTDAKELLPEAGRLGAGLRFLMQLGVDESWVYCLPDARASLGGARNAPWDQRQSLEAQAMVLLAVSEGARAMR